MSSKNILTLSILLIVLLTTLPRKTLAYWQKHPLNPIFVGGPGNTWDKLSTLNPSILQIEGLYRLIYEGNNGTGWRIGEAVSNDGLTNWIKNTEPSIPIGSPDNWENETSNPTVISTTSGILQMWYTSINTSHWNVGSDRFRLRYATKINSSPWEKNSRWILTGTPGSWDEGGIARGLSVIYKDGLYHLWYSATNTNDLAISPYWRIGYATSTSGTDWIKMNDGNPVIYPTTPWEYSNVSYPHVKFTDGVFRMWYSTGNGDVPNRIVYATSSDGINWIKPANLNPIIDGISGSFDSNNISASSIIFDNDIYKLYYSGYDGQTWRIGLATASADILDPPNTPTPNHSPTPQNTPVPTPEPTPLPPANKIIFLPGIGASWNATAFSKCLDETNPQSWTLNPLARTTYNPILRTLATNGFTVLPFYYDWRRPILHNAILLQNFVDSNTSPGERIHLIGHSMGGLVVRSYMEHTIPNPKIDHALTIGSPHQGIPNAYPAWAGGNIDLNDLTIKIALNIYLSHCKIKNEKPATALRRLIPSVQDTLPIFDYLKNFRTNAWTPFAGMLNKNSWLPSNFYPPFANLTFGTFAGDTLPTTNAYVVRPATTREINSVTWLDGKPIQTLHTNSGDGMVLSLSGHVLGATNLTLPLSHSGLLTQPSGVNAILNFLSPSAPARPLSSSSQAEPKSALVIISPDSDLILTYNSQKLSARAGEPLGILDPVKSILNLRLNPKEATSKVYVLQIVADKTIIKEYNFPNIGKKLFRLNFNPINPLTDPLK